MIRCGNTRREGDGIRLDCEVAATHRITDPTDPWPQQYRCEPHARQYLATAPWMVAEPLAGGPALIVGEQPLTANNARLAAVTGRLLAGRTVASKPLTIQLWVRNLFPGDHEPSDELTFFGRQTDDGTLDVVYVGVRTEGEMFADIGALPPEDRWLPLDSAAENVDRWSDVVPLEQSRALLAAFLDLVRVAAGDLTRTEIS